MIRLLVCCLLALAPLACAPADTGGGEAQAAPSEDPRVADWRARMQPDLNILRAEAEGDPPDVPAIAQAAARIGRVADEIAAARADDEAAAQAASTFSHEAVSLAVIAPRTYEAQELRGHVADFLAKAEAFEQAELPAPMGAADG